MKARVCFFILSFVMLFNTVVFAEKTQSDDIDAKAYILIEQSTGRVLAENNADEQLPIASVTKIMTMLLIMEAIEDGKTSFDDLVTVSENAMSYGGSTMFLETGEQLPVHDMLKGIAVASANDGCVAMAEHLTGSETAFVEEMNKRAKELGMKNTNFLNTNGLDEDGHYSSARDVALMSRELLNHPKITEYTSIWTDELRGGKFQLANTNKLIRFYTGANGLKTGSTSQALCCLSASAKRDGMQLIAVVLGAPTSDKRFSSAKSLLDYGFANYKINHLVKKDEMICDADIINGTVDSVKAIAKKDKYSLSEKSNNKDIKRRVFVNEDIKAPVKKGEVLGYV
ncbi:MAG: D-alanyl-D-alanine carboxypeptidase family protein, partial [Clostridia bacterium]|nr:D-alanyl-D-alanine carboxypeptidase family protein [Clostridia bacterium]